MRKKCMKILHLSYLSHTLSVKMGERKENGKHDGVRGGREKQTTVESRLMARVKIKEGGAS